MKLLIENWRTFINESSLSRLHQHTQEHDTAIITAHRNDPEDAAGCIEAPPETGNDNDTRNRVLKAALLRAGMGVTAVDGSYVENFEDPDPLKRVEVSEESFFVVNLKDSGTFVDEVKKLGELFCQDSILIIPRGGTGAYLLGTNDTSFPGLGNEESVGDYSAGQEAEFMSRVRGRTFTFKEVKELETYEGLSRNAKWAVAKMTERLFKK